MGKQIHDIVEKSLNVLKRTQIPFYNYCLFGEMNYFIENTIDTSNNVILIIVLFIEYGQISVSLKS